MQELINTIGFGMLAVISLVLYYKIKSLKEQIRWDNNNYRTDQDDLKSQLELNEKMWLGDRKGLEQEILATRESAQLESTKHAATIRAIQEALIGYEQR